MKITIKPAAPPPAPVPVPASSLRAGDRFRVVNGTGIVLIRTTAPLSSLTACMEPNDGWLGRLAADHVIPCDNDGNPIIPPARAPEPVPLSSLAVGDVFRYANGTGACHLNLGPSSYSKHRYHVVSLADMDLGWDTDSCRVIKVEAELVIGGDR